jgi:hypothetical protein
MIIYIDESLHEVEIMYFHGKYGNQILFIYKNTTGHTIEDEYHNQNDGGLLRGRMRYQDGKLHGNQLHWSITSKDYQYNHCMTMDVYYNHGELMYSTMPMRVCFDY